MTNNACVWWCSLAGFCGLRCWGPVCVSHGVVEVICSVPFVGCVGSASHLRSKSQGRTGGGSWLLDDRPDGVREPRYNDEVILVGVPAAQPFPGLGWGRPAI